MIGVATIRAGMTVARSAWAVATGVARGVARGVETGALLVVLAAGVPAVGVALTGCGPWWGADRPSEPTVPPSDRSPAMARQLDRSDELNPVPDLVASMSAREKSAQLLLIGFAGADVPPELRTLLEECPVGGVILFDRNIRSGPDLVELTSELQESARRGGSGVPLLVAVDQEGGPVRRIREGVPEVPAARTLGESASPDEARTLATESAKALLALGINTNLAPVADVVADSTSFLYRRTYSGDPDVVSAYVSAVIEGQEAAGLVSVVKHFPGHGSAPGDSHAGAVRSETGLGEFEAVHLRPFREAVRAGVPVVMLSHVVAPALGSEVPSSASSEVVRLLRDDLGFEGVVLTDDMEMSGSAGAGDAAVAAVRAGVDMVLVGHSAEEQSDALEALTMAAELGSLPASRLDEAVTRVLRLKITFGLLPAALLVGS